MNDPTNLSTVSSLLKTAHYAITYSKNGNAQIWSRQKCISLLHFHNSNAELQVNLTLLYYYWLNLNSWTWRQKKSVYLVKFTEKGSRCSLIKDLDTAICFGSLLVLVLYLPLGMCAKMTQSTIYTKDSVILISVLIRAVSPWTWRECKRWAGHWFNSDVCV